MGGWFDKLLLVEIVVDTEIKCLMVFYHNLIAMEL